MKIIDKTTGSIWIDLATKRRLERGNKMKKKEWEKFWEYLLMQAFDSDNWWLHSWLEEEKERYENEEKN
jgi:hypothetical protein